MTFSRTSLRRVRSPPAPIDIPSNPRMDEFCLGPIDLDEDVVGPLKHLVVPDIPKLTTSIDEDKYAFMGRSW